MEEEGLDAARGAEPGWGSVREGVEGLGGDRRVHIGDDLSLANATASSAGAGLTASAGLTVVSTAAGTKGEILTIEPRRDGIFACEVLCETAADWQ